MSAIAPGGTVQFTNHEGTHVGTVERLTPNGKSALVRYHKGSVAWTAYIRLDDLTDKMSDVMAVHTDAELLDVYLAATTLVTLHSKEGGLELSRQHYEKKADEYRREILKRMAS